MTVANASNEPNPNASNVSNAPNDSIVLRKTPLNSRHLGGIQARIGWMAIDGKGAVATLPGSTPYSQRNAVLSPDGRWVAYESYESGIGEVYVRPFPDVNAGRWQLSSGGGRWPVWHPAPGGRELFYIGPKGLMATSVTTTPAFTPGATTLLFDSKGYTATSEVATSDGAPNRRYAVARDGQRFLFLKAEATSSTTSQRVMFVENWTEELKQRVPN